jgi:signal transduction histidine kinase
LDWHLLREGGGAEHLTAGNQRVPSSELADHRLPIFPLKLRAGERVEVFLRVRSQTAVHLPLRLWSGNAFVGAQAVSESIFAAFLGYLGALILLSLVFSAFTGDRGYALYSLSLIGLLAHHLIMNGYYGWAGGPAAGIAAHAGATLSTQLTLLLVPLYLRHFFDLGVTMPKMDIWAKGLAWAAVVATPLLLALPYRICAQVLPLEALLMGGWAMAVATLAWWRGNRIARFYTLAWISFWLVFAMQQLQFRGRLPMFHMTPELLGIVGVATSITLFFVAMADRVRLMRRRAVQAEQRVIEMERRSSEEMRGRLLQQQRLIRDLHDGLGSLDANIGLLAERGRRELMVEGKDILFERISRLAMEAGMEVRSLVDSLEAGTIGWGEVIENCRRRAALAFEPANVRCDVTQAGRIPEPGLPALASLSLLRLIREALHNILKHARASQVRVHFDFTERCVITIEDDGCGMPAGTRRRGRGIGNMQQRMKELGGAMHIESSRGVRIVLQLPLPMQLHDGAATASEGEVEVCG